MPSSDSPANTYTVILSRVSSGFVNNVTDFALLKGVSQVPDLTINTRCSLSSRIARQLQMPIASLSIVDFAHFGRLVAITGLTRPNRIHLRYGWCFCLNESHPSQLLSQSVVKLRAK
jgi:hypothetical protein